MLVQISTPDPRLFSSVCRRGFGVTLVFDFELKESLDNKLLKENIQCFFKKTRYNARSDWLMRKVIYYVRALIG